jgi:hypothetical protein
MMGQARSGSSLRHQRARGALRAEKHRSCGRAGAPWQRPDARVAGIVAIALSSVVVGLVEEADVAAEQLAG